jgi:hypothetical protein
MKTNVMSMSNVSDQICRTPDTFRVASPLQGSAMETGVANRKGFPGNHTTSHAANGAARCAHDCPRCNSWAASCEGESFPQAGEDLVDDGFAVLAPETPCAALRRGQRKGQDPVQEEVASESHDPMQRPQASAPGNPGQRRHLDQDDMYRAVSLRSALQEHRRPTALSPEMLLSVDIVIPLGPARPSRPQSPSIRPVTIWSSILVDGGHFAISVTGTFSNDCFVFNESG